MKLCLEIAGVLLVICLVAVFDQGSCCRLSWIRFGDTCYRIFPKGYSRHASRLHCLLIGSDLASVTDVSVLDFLAQHVAHTEGDKFWVGLVRRSDGQLAWIDGDTNFEDQPWVKIPDDDHHITGFEAYRSSCFAYDGAAVAKTHCYENLGQICSYNFTTQKKHIECRWAKHSFIGDSTGNCLFSPQQTTTRDQVDKLCSLNNAHFVDVDGIFRDGLTAFFNHQVLANDGSKYWTGFTWNGTDLSWNLGESVPEEYRITVVPGNGSCITVQFNFTDVLQTQFYQTDCDDRAYVVCSESLEDDDVPSTTTTDPDDMLQMDDPDSLKCPDGHNWKSDRSRRNCYWETSFETNQIPWEDAESYCQAFGGHLASFHSEDEERIGLSFQYGSFSHPYWIGLHLDVETETYKWSDGSPLNYSNWAPGHPNHKDKQLKCVAMEANNKHWISSICGIHSWFICKVSAKAYHPVPHLPRATPLETCDSSHPDDSVFRSSGSPFQFRGACYFAVNEIHSWHRAKQYCENEGASLASIHSVEEIEFLLRLLHDMELLTNRVWIGLNAFGTDGSFHWTDWTGYDFNFFGANEPNNFQNQEKCCNMKAKNGEWSDENCNVELAFICKRFDDANTAVIPATVDPTIGNCKKGWIAHQDRCYYVGGKREKDRMNWTEALDICQKSGSYLTSIREQSEQNFLSYLLQTLEVDAWIGLHDTIQSGRYYWQDNSELRYTNWAPGEPSFFGIMEDCVKMVYDHLDSGVWKDEECGHKLGYICQTRKDPELPESPRVRGLDCPHPEGWMKLDNMCFKMFAGDGLTWKRAENTCQKEGGHLVSVSDQRVKAVVAHMASEVNQPFFIGLKYQADIRKVSWLNEYPVLVSDWEKNEPSSLSEEMCFASTSEGYWKKASCEDEMPFMCQITTGKPPKQAQYTGECPPTSTQWVPGSNSFCYILDGRSRFDWFTSNLMCFRHVFSTPSSDYLYCTFEVTKYIPTCKKQGAHLASIHSTIQIEDIKEQVKPNVKSVYIGLMRNKKGGWSWMDDTPMDFVNWDEEQPSSSDQCVEMMTDTMKWRLTPCEAKKHYVCMDKKVTLVYEDPQSAEYVVDAQSGLSTAAICAVVASILVIGVVIGAAVLYRMRSNQQGVQFRRHARNHSVSFENALYNVGRSSMEFHDDNKDSL